MFIRVRDKDTKHEFDVPEASPLIRKGLVEPVKGDRYPVSPVARPAKHHTSLASAAPAPTTTKKES